MHKEYRFIDCTEKYHSVMQFDKNKNVFIHRWYPFVEGYSKEFIEDILEELPFVPTCALEPFCGSGTTPVELQNHDIKCYSFEVSPFMHLLSIVKLGRNYNVDTFEHYVKAVTKKLSHTNKNIRRIESLPFGNTIVKKDQSKKWNFHDPAIDGILDIRHAIRTIVDNDNYKNLFTIALASIIIQASNMFRNGKCLSYKKGWKNRIFSRKEIHNFFLDKLNSIFAEDIRIISNQNSSVHNSKICYLGDVRKNINQVPDGKVDLIITSPPYEELRELRKHTLRSHVQIPYDKILPIENERLRNSLLAMSNKELDTWNHHIINMICAYFEDMQLLFSEFAKKMHKGGVIYFNVANSAYYGVEVPVDYIIADIAESCGFKVREIRKARDLKTSPQQSDKIGKLRESVIVIDYK